MLTYLLSIFVAILFDILFTSFMALNNNPIVFLVRKLWQFSQGNRKRVVLYVLLFLGANTVATIEPLLVAKVLDVIALEGVTHENIRFIILLSSLFIAVQFAFWMFHGPARVIEITNAFKARANYKMFLLEGTLDLPASWHTDHHSGDTIDKIEKGSQALYRFGSESFTLIESVARLITSFIILAYFDINSTIIVSAMVALTVFAILKFDKRLIAQYDQINKAENASSAKVFDVISNVTTVIILRIEKLVTKAISKKLHQPYELFVRNNKMNEFKWFTVSVAGALVVFFVLCSYFVGTIAAGTVVTIGSVYLLYSYVMRVTDVFFRFAYQYGDVVQQKTNILNAESIAKDFEGRKRISTIRQNMAWKRLIIDHLTFSYHTDSGADLHLEDISLTIKHGERIALIGESGSGKTTFLKILRGLYAPKQGNISLDRKTLKYGIEMMSEHIALIPQDPEIFSTTIKENITMGVEHSLATIKKFADMARFTEVAERLPHKWDSSIVEKGVNLSGGEKQRLALARGLMACTDKSIILLDEPTSSIDMKNEAMIYQNIFKTFKDKTVISSIHRLHLLHLFDVIYFFKDGKIIASGSFQELLTSSPPFQMLWEKYQEAQN